MRLHFPKLVMLRILSICFAAWVSFYPAPQHADARWFVPWCDLGCVSKLQACNSHCETVPDSYFCHEDCSYAFEKCIERRIQCCEFPWQYIPRPWGNELRTKILNELNGCFEAVKRRYD